LFLTAQTSELIDIGKMPSSCADMERMGQKVNGFFLVKGSKKMELIYCNFFANQNGTTSFNFIFCLFALFIFVYRQPEMDRIRRRQIAARPFPRTEKFSFCQKKNSDSVRFGAGERGKRHEFDIGEIHGPATGNLFFLFRGTCAS
jgi:hypothetical protein